MSTAYATRNPVVVGPGRKSVILLVDGDLVYLDTVAHVLELDGHCVLRATSGEAGLEIARRQQPDIIFLEVALPGSGGMGLLRRLKSDPMTNDIPVVVVSGRCERHLIDDCRRLGAIDFVVKGMSVAATQGYAVKMFARHRSRGV